ncbi:MAG: autotransporter domain-containing protein, partial [Proteobacteria bacterium]|nr:autotransporter domain-containing protein [Pseudomonadota bacterium]
DADRLTLQGGTLLTTSSFTLNTNRGIALGASHGSINVAAGTTLTYDGVIAGGNNLTKLGTGTLDLGGANTYSGTTTISAGELNVTGTLSDSTAVTVAGSATYDSDTTDTIGSIEGAGNIEIADSTTLTVGGDDSSTTFSGVISGSGNLTKTGRYEY